MRFGVTQRLWSPEEGGASGLSLKGHQEFGGWREQHGGGGCQDALPGPASCARAPGSRFLSHLRLGVRLVLTVAPGARAVFADRTQPSARNREDARWRPSQHSSNIINEGQSHVPLMRQALRVHHPPNPRHLEGRRPRAWFTNAQLRLGVV